MNRHKLLFRVILLSFILVFLFSLVPNVFANDWYGVWYGSCAGACGTGSWEGHATGSGCAYAAGNVQIFIYYQKYECKSGAQTIGEGMCEHSETVCPGNTVCTAGVGCPGITCPECQYAASHTCVAYLDGTACSIGNCFSGACYSCDLGRVVGSYVCGTGKVWIIPDTTNAETSKYSCAKLVKNDPNAFADVFIPNGEGTVQNNCCGDDGVADLGAMIDDYVCTNITGWKWENAKSPPANTFKILPIDKSYQVVSNGATWFACNPNSALQVQGASFTGIQLPHQQGVTFDANQWASTPLPGGTGTTVPGTISQENIAQDDLFRGISTVKIVQTNRTYNYSTSGFNIKFNVPYGEIQRFETLILNITGLPAGSRIDNTSDNEIKIVSGNTILPVSHEVQSGNKMDFSLAIPYNLNEGSYSLNITILDQSGAVFNSYLLQNAFSIVGEVMGLPTSSYEVNPERFLCYNLGSYADAMNSFGAILECCGPYYSTCLNKNGNYVNYNLTRMAGGPTSLLQDYYGSLTKNTVLRMGFPQSGGYTRYPYVVNATIKNWNIYDSLEFDILFVGTNNSGSSKLNISINGTSGVLFNDYILKYSTTGDQTDRWHHIKIPIGTWKSNAIKSITFYSMKDVLSADITSNNRRLINVSGYLYFMMFGLDRIYLSSSESFFCGTDFEKYQPDASYNDLFGTNTITKIGRWISDLDKDRDACNNVPSYKWTNNLLTDQNSNEHNYCCGDDQNRSILAGGSETYNGEKAGCWRGLPIDNNTLVRETISIE